MNSGRGKVERREKSESVWKPNTEYIVESGKERMDAEFLKVV